MLVVVLFLASVTLPLKGIVWPLVILSAVSAGVNYHWMLQTIAQRDALEIKYAPSTLSKSSHLLLAEHYKRHHGVIEEENLDVSVLKP